MHARKRPQERTKSKRSWIVPHQFPADSELIERGAAVEHAESGIFREHMFDDVFVFFSLQRTCRVDQPTAKDNLRHCGTQNGHLPFLQIGQVLRPEPPLDFRMAGKRAGAGTGHIGEHSIKVPGKRKIAGVRGEDPNVRWICARFVIHSQEPSQQARAMRMKFDGRDLCIRIAVCHRQGLAAGSRTAIKDARSASRQCCDELRSFILDHTSAGAEGSSLRDVDAFNQPRRGQQTAGLQFNSFGLEFFVGLRSPKTNGRFRNRLIVTADVMDCFDSVFPSPSLNQPLRMRERVGDAFDRRGWFVRKALIHSGSNVLQLPQDRIDERSRGSFARTLHQFHALVNGSAVGNAAQPAKLIQAEAESNKGL